MEGASRLPVGSVINARYIVWSHEFVKDVLGIVWDESEAGVDISGIPFWKRNVDVFCILLALPVVLPIGLLIALWVKGSSRGPVFFRQERIGHKGVHFTCLKFRSMKVNADAGVHESYFRGLMQSRTPMTKMDTKGDRRLIPLGAILRSTGLDELPQLINVLRGEMSLVGPRPCIPYEFEGYLPWQKERFDTLPGLTGLWQVSGKNNTTFEEMIRLDITYARDKSLWLDLSIILKTVPALFHQVRETAVRKVLSTSETAVAQ
jgi:lipopolysaccharide/colanic/teichoic acid biosynthesis glycosyltransferase